MAARIVDFVVTFVPRVIFFSLFWVSAVSFQGGPWIWPTTHIYLRDLLDEVLKNTNFLNKIGRKLLAVTLFR